MPCQAFSPTTTMTTPPCWDWKIRRRKSCSINHPSFGKFSTPCSSLVFYWGKSSIQRGFLSTFLKLKIFISLLMFWQNHKIHAYWDSQVWIWGLGFILSISFLSLTIWTVVLLQEKDSSIEITDTFGYKHEVPAFTLYAILIISWICHILAGILTIIYYISHPSRVDLNPREKCHIWCLGTKRNVSWLFCLKGG